MTKILYIAGYGRSGSTLLERVLSSHQKLFGTGELFSFLDLLARNDEFQFSDYQLQEGDFWFKVAKDIFDDSISISELKNIQMSFESLSRIFGYLLGQPVEKQKKYEIFSQKIFDSITQHIPNQVDYIIDSSKTARNTFFRPIALTQIAHKELKVIHLVRDGRGCMSSYLKGSNRKLEHQLNPDIAFAAPRAAFGWFLANTSAHIFQKFSSADSYCRVRYEDFVENPEQTLKKIGDFLSIDFENQINMLKSEENIPLANQITGNRLRKQEKIVLKMDIAWKKKLSWYHRLFFWILNWPYALLYGYR